MKPIVFGVFVFSTLFPKVSLAQNNTVPGSQKNLCPSASNVIVPVVAGGLLANLEYRCMAVVPALHCNTKNPNPSQHWLSPVLLKISQLEECPTFAHIGVSYRETAADHAPADGTSQCTCMPSLF